MAHREQRARKKPPNAERPGEGPAVCLSLLPVGPADRPLAQGITPTMSAPMKANAQHTINALIGLVSPMP